jgi:hypoxanthine phosphoribosyltransferase
MDTVQVKDRIFVEYLSEDKIICRVNELAKQINTDLAGKSPLFLVVLNGSFIFAADLVRRVTIPCEISFIRVASYEGMSTTGNVKQVLGLKEDIEGRTVVVVEDIIDSGLTMSELLGILQKKHPAKIHIASLLVKPESMKVDLDIHYKCFDIPNDFILGYGLDYEGEGRNLRSIYRVVNS